MKGENRLNLQAIAKENRQQQIALVEKAINQLLYTGIAPCPPNGILLARWRAMINFMFKNGKPT